MSKSLDFIKNRIDQGFTNGMENNNYSDFVEVDRNFLGREHIEYQLKEKEGGEEINVDIVYNPDVDFEYFTMERCVCDGTSMFYEELVKRVFDNIILTNTYNNMKCPSDYTENPFKYDKKYIIGNPIFTNEYGEEFATKEKPWMKSRFSVMLPIKMEFIEI